MVESETFKKRKISLPESAHFSFISGLQTNIGSFSYFIWLFFRNQTISQIMSSSSQDPKLDKGRRPCTTRGFPSENENVRTKSAIKMKNRTYQHYRKGRKNCHRRWDTYFRDKYKQTHYIRSYTGNCLHTSYPDIHHPSLKRNICNGLFLRSKASPRSSHLKKSLACIYEDEGHNT